MKILRVATLGTALAATAFLTACSGQNKYEREAWRITQAVMNNNMAPVQGDLAPGIHLTRVQVAAAADELDGQGKLESIVEHKPCPIVGAHCFVVKFQKSTYHEVLAMDDQGKVTRWTFHMADAR